MKRVHQAGFAMFELVLIVVFVAAVAGVGYMVIKQRSNTADTTVSTSGASSVPAAPAINKTSDLTTAEQTLHDIDLDAGANDSASLDAQTNGF